MSIHARKDATATKAVLEAQRLCQNKERDPLTGRKERCPNESETSVETVAGYLPVCLPCRAKLERERQEVLVELDSSCLQIVHEDD